MKPIAIALVIIAVLVLVGGWYWQSQQTAAAPATAPKPVVGGASASAPTTGPTTWRCAALIAGKDANILRRQADKSLECATMDGKNCYWYGNIDACNAAFASVNKDANAPLNCAGNHITLYGDGRTNPAHWCYNGRTDV